LHSVPALEVDGRETAIAMILADFPPIFEQHRIARSALPSRDHKRPDRTHVAQS